MSSLEALEWIQNRITSCLWYNKRLYTNTNSGKTIVMCWIPSHVNISGSERADIAAKSALSLPITGMKIPAEELIPGISKFCMNEWQDIWDCSQGNKLHSLYPKVGAVKHSKTLSRCDYVFIYRLKVGHCRLTHLVFIIC